MSKKNFKGKKPYTKRTNSNRYDAGVVREQPRKDSGDRRINLDNARVNRLEKDIEREDDKASAKRAWAKTGAKNDLSWISHNPELLKSAGGFSTYFPTGDIFDGLPSSMPAGSQWVMASIPSIMQININHYLGPDSLPTLRQCAEDIYSFVVHANSRNTTYDPTDMMMLILGATNLFAYAAKGIRLYGVMLDYTAENMALPDDLIRAMGFDPVSVRRSYSSMYYDINLRIARLNDVWIPKDIHLLERWFWLNTNIYVDSNSIKDQMYIFNPVNYFKLAEVASTTGTSLVPVTKVTVFDWMNSTVEWSKYLEALDEMIDAFMASQDRGKIEGDILRAYGFNRLFKLSQIDINYKVVPTYEPEVLTEIMNATIVPCMYMDGVGQDVNSLNFTTHYNATHLVNNSRIDPNYGPVIYYEHLTPQYVFMNFKDGIVPTPENIGVCSQLTAAGNKNVAQTAAPTNVIVPATAGTETVHSVIVYYKGLAPSGQISTTKLYVDRHENVERNALMPFDWRPFMYVLTNKSGSSTPADLTVTLPTLPEVIYNKYIRGEMENFFPVGLDSLRRLHQLCLLSYLGVPVDISGITAAK